MLSTAKPIKTPFPTQNFTIDDIDDMRYGRLRNQDLSLNGLYSEDTRLIAPKANFVGHLNPIWAAKYFIDYHRKKNFMLQSLYKSNKIMDNRKILREKYGAIGRLPRFNDPVTHPNYRGIPTATFEYDNGKYPVDLDYTHFDDMYGNSNNITQHEYVWPASFYDGIPWGPQGQLFNRFRENYKKESDHHPYPKNKTKKVTFQGVSEF